MENQDGASTSSGDYESALRRYDQLVREFDHNVHNLAEEDVITIEAQLIRSLCYALFIRPNDSPGVRPKLDEWLRVVGLSPTNIRHIELCGIHDIVSLMQKNEREAKSIADRGRYSPESKRRILRICEGMRSYYDVLKGRRDSNSLSDKHLAWSTKCSPPQKKTATWRAASAESSTPPSPFLLADSSSRGRESPSSSSDLLLPSGSGSFPGSPNIPTSAYHSRSASGSGSLSVLSGRTTLSPSSMASGSAHSTPTLGVANRVTQSTSMSAIATDRAKSPTMSRLVHAIPHKWRKLSKFRIVSDQNCNFCQRPLGFGFLNTWEKCRSCKWKVHTQCKNRIGDSCGLTPDHLRRLLEDMIRNSNGNMWNEPPHSVLPLSSQEPAFQFPDSNQVADSSSSTNSSAPSTPAMPILPSPYGQMTAPARSNDRKFTFEVPDIVPEVPDIVLPEGEHVIGDEIRIGAGPSRRLESSEGTLVADSQGSGQLDLTASEEHERDRESPSHNWDRHRWNMNTIRGVSAQASWNEVTIPYSALEFKKNNLLGAGRFGKVLRGYHYGDVAVKFLDMDYVDESKRLEEFKNEVAAHKNTRHDSIVLFLGCCVEQDRLGIVMSLCKGPSLHVLLHENRERLSLNELYNIATQICQGVSYLHTKKILHKDLRSKNIFIDSKKKVVITDFGLLSMSRLRYPKRNYTLILPQYWLSYQAPEIMRSISEIGPEPPFSEMSDMYAFGTIWYELLTYGYPFSGHSPDTIVFMVASGMKPPLHNVKTSKEAKHKCLEILMSCWSFAAEERPSFTDLHKLFDNLPRKRVDRSPSFPIMKYHESMF